MSTVSSSQTNLGTASGGFVKLYNTNDTDGNFSQIGGYNSNNLVTGQINFINTDQTARLGELGFMTHNGTLLTERMRIDSDGKVGIGVIDPAVALDISSGTLTDIRIRGNATTDSRLGGISWWNTAASDVIAAINVDRDGANDAGAITFDTQAAGGGNTEKMRISSDGVVSITNAVSGINAYVQNTTHNSVFMIKTTPTAKNSELWFGDGDSNQVGKIDYDHNTDAMSFVTSSTERLRIQGSDTFSQLLINGKESIANSNAIIRMQSTNAAGVVTADSQIKSTSDGTTYGSNLIFSTNSTGNQVTDRLTITNTGYTTIEATSSVVEGDTRSVLRIQENNTPSAGRGGGLVFGRLTETYGGIKTLQNTASNDNATMFFQTIGTGTLENRMAINHLGYVGIGTDTPTAQLEIRGETASHELVSINRAASETAALYLGNNASNNAVIAANYTDLILGRDQSGTLTEYLRIKNVTGNVGIGTDNPQNLLQINSPETGSVSNAYINIFSGHTATGGSDTTGETGILFRNFTGTQYFRAGAIVSGREGNYSVTSLADSYLRFETAANNVNTERLRIKSNGDVGIGDNDPNSRLIVKNVDGTNDGIRIHTADGTEGFVIFRDDTDASIGAIVYNHDTNELGFKTNNVSDRLIIDSGGSVGINEANPKARLDVNGDINTTGYNSDTLEFSTHFTSGTSDIATLSSAIQSTVAVATLEYVGLYSYGGSAMVAGILMASTRYNNVPAWNNSNDITVNVNGSSTQYEPTLFWDNGVLKITVSGSVQITGKVRITYHDVTLTRNYPA